MKYLTKKHSGLLIFGCWLIYTAAYVGRLDYSASMVEIIDALGITNDQGGTVYSCFALAYGIGQLVNGLLCKHYNPKYVITGALCGTATVNLLMSLVSDYRVMAVLWLLNGAVQSMLYSLIIRTIALNIKSSGISRAIYTMSTTIATGTGIAYGISALCVALGAWRATFVIASAVLFCAAVVWVFIISKIERARANGEIEEDDVPKTSKDTLGASRISRAFIATFVFIGIVAVANGFIKDGVNNWLPKLLRDEFAVDDSLSISLTFLLPVFSIFGSIFARRVYMMLKNHLLLNGIFYGVAFALSFGVFLIYPMRSVPLTMILFIGLACMMAAINNVITGMFPLDNRDKMNPGLCAGLLDTLCYLGSSSAGILLGVVSQNSGWRSVLIILFALTASAAAICLLFSLLSSKGLRKSTSREG